MEFLASASWGYACVFAMAVVFAYRFGMAWLGQREAAAAKMLASLGELRAHVESEFKHLQADTVSMARWQATLDEIEDARRTQASVTDAAIRDVQSHVKRVDAELTQHKARVEPRLNMLELNSSSSRNAIDDRIDEVECQHKDMRAVVDKLGKATAELASMHSSRLTEVATLDNLTKHRADLDATIKALAEDWKRALDATNAEVKRVKDHTESQLAGTLSQLPLGRGFNR